MRNIVILNSLHFSYPLPILMRVSYNTLIVKQNTSDYYKYMNFYCFVAVRWQVRQRTGYIKMSQVWIVDYKHVSLIGFNSDGERL